MVGSIKDHPFYIRMKQLPPQEVAEWVLGVTPVEHADKSLRKEAFRCVAKHITAGKAERAKYGFNSDTNGEIARAMEWAFQARMKAAKEPANHGKAKHRTAAALAPIPDRRAMESHLAGLADHRGESALDAAQDLMYDAWDAAGKRARVALARKALRVSPLCADAYVLLAEETARSVPEALDIYRKGVEAGELALGEETFAQDVGHFWGLLETRPYMRARSGLAQALWASGEREEAIGHYRDMLRLNPDDNQGIRYLLAACLLTMARQDDLDTLLKEYNGDGSAGWTYTQALASFRHEGDTKRSRNLLTAAAASNGHVPAYLLGERKLPQTRPDYITMTGEDEAIEYVREFGPGWERTPGALAWLRDTWPQLPRPKRGRGRH